MTSTVNISSPEQFGQLLQSSKFVMAYFFKSTSNPDITSTLYRQLADTLASSARVAFVEINIDQQKSIKDAYEVTSTPSFFYFRDGVVVQKVHSVTPSQLRELVARVFKDATEKTEAGTASAAAAAAASTSSQAKWRGADLPRGYSDVNDQIELQRSELLNYDASCGGVRVLFDGSKPSALSGGKATAKDWVESDTDEQLMLYIPFQSVLKLHTLQITSLPPKDDDDDEAPMRPRTIKLFTNKAHNLGFDEAEDMAGTQDIELSEKDWNAEGTANIPLRFVKFQKVTSLVIFVVDGDGESEKVRLDRVRLVGEAGEKREMGKLEKIGEGSE
ncbi:PITH domain-containing protein [Podospora conica]|nr:PITH domain-containing protein [Schizothecium conicum]